MLGRRKISHYFPAVYYLLGGMRMMNVLPDVLLPGLKAVFCGTAVGPKSAARGAYYAGPGNKFWPVLKEIGLTPRILSPEEFPSLLQYGLGLTDLSKRRSGLDSDLEGSDFDVIGFAEKIAQNSPRVVCFNGKKAGKVFFDKQRVNYGFQPETIGTTRIFIATSTSSAANGEWDVGIWRQLANWINGSA
jgi:TDG/mug DNA glycosylase family protein